MGCDGRGREGGGAEMSTEKGARWMEQRGGSGRIEAGVGGKVISYPEYRCLKEKEGDILAFASEIQPRAYLNLS